MASLDADDVRQQLVVDGRAVCVVEVPGGLNARRRGLVGRDGIDGAMLLRRCPAVHTVGMRFAVDVAFLDKRMVVIDSLSMAPGRARVASVAGPGLP